MSRNGHSSADLPSSWHTPTYPSAATPAARQVGHLYARNYATHLTLTNVHPILWKKVYRTLHIRGMVEKFQL